MSRSTLSIDTVGGVPAVFDYLKGHGRDGSHGLGLLSNMSYLCSLVFSPKTNQAVWSQKEKLSFSTSRITQIHNPELGEYYGGIPIVGEI